MQSIVLALGGGGVRGVAHIGVIRRLEQAGYHIAGIAGTSAGAVVGSLYSSGCSTEEIEQLMEHMTHRDFFGRSPHDGPSIMGMAGLKRALQEKLGEKTFRDLRIPFASTAVDLRSDRELILNQGSLLDAVLASSAVPGVFPAVQIGDYELVDGGVLDPVPVSVARWLVPGTPVIAVCLQPVPEQWAEMPAAVTLPAAPIPQPIREQLSRLRIAQAFRIFGTSMDITSRMLAELRLQIDKPDVIIRPKVADHNLLDTSSLDGLIERGEMAASMKLDDIQRAFSWRDQLTRRFRSPNLSGIVLDPKSRPGLPPEEK